MARRGPKPTPPELKLLKGETRPSRVLPDRAVAPPGRPQAPESLSESEQVHFERIVDRLEGMGIASEADVGIITLAAKRWAEIERLDEKIEEFGEVYESLNRDGQRLLKANPAVRMSSEAKRHLHALESTLGLSPSDRGRVSTGHQAKKPENPYAALPGRRGT